MHPIIPFSEIQINSVAYRFDGGNEGNVVIAPPETPHKLTNTGTAPLRQISIHPSKEITTTWLDKRRSNTHVCT